jgi:hypothetical protein
VIACQRANPYLLEHVRVADDDQQLLGTCHRHVEPLAVPEKPQTLPDVRWDVPQPSKETDSSQKIKRRKGSAIRQSWIVLPELGLPQEPGLINSTDRGKR